MIIERTSTAARSQHYEKACGAISVMLLVVGLVGTHVLADTPVTQKTGSSDVAQGPASIDVSGLSGQVFLDSELRGVVPLTIENVPYGVHELRIRREGYKDFVERISVNQPILRVNVDWEKLESISAVDARETQLRIKRETGTVRIMSLPPEMHAVFAGCTHTTTCQLYPVPQGWQSIEIDNFKRKVFVCPNALVTVEYNSITKSFQCDYSPDADIDLLIEAMQKTDGDAIRINIDHMKQKIASHPQPPSTQATTRQAPTAIAIIDIVGFDGEVFIDEKPCGTAPASFHVTYGKRQFLFKRTGWKDQVLELNVNSPIQKINLSEEAPGDVAAIGPESIRLTMEAETGSLKVVSDPPNLPVKFGGTTDKTTFIVMKVPQGLHDIEVMGQKRKVFIYPNQTVTVRYHADSKQFLVSYPAGFKEERLHVLVKSAADDAIIGDVEALKTRWEELDFLGAEAAIRQEFTKVLIGGVMSLLQERPPKTGLAVRQIQTMQSSGCTVSAEQKMQVVAVLSNLVEERLTGTNGDREGALSIISQTRELFPELLSDKVRKNLVDILIDQMQNDDLVHVHEVWKVIDPDQRERERIKEFLSRQEKTFGDFMSAKTYFDRIGTEFPDLLPACALMTAQLAEKLLDDVKAIAYYDAVVSAAPGSPEAKIAAKRSASITYWRNFSFANLFFFFCVGIAAVVFIFTYFKNKSAEKNWIRQLSSTAEKVAWDWLTTCNLAVPHSAPLGAAISRANASSLETFAITNVVFFAVVFGLIGSEPFAVNFLLAMVYAVCVLTVSLLVVKILDRFGRASTPHLIPLSVASSFVLTFLWIPALGPALALMWWLWFANNLLFSRVETENYEDISQNDSDGKSREGHVSSWIGVLTFRARLRCYGSTIRDWFKALTASFSGSMTMQGQRKKMPEDVFVLFPQVNVMIFALARTLSLGGNFVEDFFYSLLVSMAVLGVIWIIMLITSKVYETIRDPLYLTSLASVILVVLWVPVIGILFTIGWSILFASRVTTFVAASKERVSNGETVPISESIASSPGSSQELGTGVSSDTAESSTSVDRTEEAEVTCSESDPEKTTQSSNTGD